jgi:N6-L-threonylcarbamoyladenine synthase
MGLPYPGGISVSVVAQQGNAAAFKLPKARMQGKYDFSFSGLKTAVLRTAQELVGKDYSLPSYELPGMLNDAQKADIAASFERVAYETIVDKTVMAFEEFAPKSFVIGGGVAANAELRRQLAERLPLPIEYPDRKLCGDNGAMIATLGCYHVQLGRPTADPYTLECAPNLSM